MTELRQAIVDTLRVFKARSLVMHRESWQGLDVAKKPEMATHELIGYTLLAKVTGSLDYIKRQVRPDLPWADDHFEERVSGRPLNPPPSEEWWPHAPKGNSQFKKNGIFSHTYPERYWPKMANPNNGKIPRHGIRYPYGDLADVIDLLKREPFTRQAYLPVWFPEDTGNVMRERTPCSLGYHFMMTPHQTLDIAYYIRSCDLLRHFRNDIYFTVRLLLWVLSKLDGDPWATTRPGYLRMHISSLHCFRNDFQQLFGPAA